jgi:Xaa-Pro aminopeptidase
MQNTKIEIIKQLLAELKLDAYLVPSSNEWQLQFVDDCLNRLRYLTGFTGSAGTALITSGACHYFFTDGRYVEQARKELPETFEVIHIPLSSWIERSGYCNKIIGFDSKLHSQTQIEALEKCIVHGRLAAIKDNLVDRIWKDRVPGLKRLAVPHPLEYAGKSIEAKHQLIIDHLTKFQLHATIITDPSSISWFLNLRAIDADFEPCITGVLVIFKTKAMLFTDDQLSAEALKQMSKSGVEVCAVSQLEGKLKELSKHAIEISAQASHWLWHFFKKPSRHNNDPCVPLKACKNDVELKGAQQACIRDSRALTKCLEWVKRTIATDKTKLTELDVGDKLLEFRRAEDKFVGPSFQSIVGFQENAAIIHYHPTIATNKTIQGNGMLLVDSGGHYLDGTTDITRTIAIGKPAAEQRQDFTLVLKGHIALASAIFPEGTTGAQLDILARMHLWAEGKDYAHGTGHGVGSLLSVHEGPQSISKHGHSVALLPGMIVSIEPGFYKTRAYGIRIENLAYVAKHEISGYLSFRVLTYVPIDESLIDHRMLSDSERQWVMEYNKKCNEIFDCN